MVAVADIRFDLVVLQSGMTMADVRANAADRLADHPVVVVRRQGIGEVTWHRLSAEQLDKVLHQDGTIAELFDLSALNEVAVHQWLEVGEEAPHGVLLLGTQLVAFSDAPHEGGHDLPTRTPTDLDMMTHEEPRSALPPRSRPDQRRTDDSFSAHPAIGAPVMVERDEVFTVSISLGDQPVHHTPGSLEIAHLGENVEDLDLAIELVGPFDPAPGASLQGTMRVSRSTLDHEPLNVQLLPGHPPDSFDTTIGVWTARITAIFSYEGCYAGEAYREIRVNENRSRSNELASARRPVRSGSSEVTFAETAEDLTIRISHRDGNPASPRFDVSVTSPHLSPAYVGEIDLGVDPTSFAARLITEIGYDLANRVSDESLRTIGLRIAEKVPEGLFGMIRDVWDAVAAENEHDGTDRAPDVLLLTDETAVPWELMQSDLVPDTPPHLGAHVNIGRWPLDFIRLLSDRPVGIRALGVMIGHYKETYEWDRLPRAEAEGRQLETDYVARVVDADDGQLNQLLRGRFDDGFEFEGLHFAGHGKSDPDEGMYMAYSDGTRMSTLPFGSSELAQKRDAFLFVNACQVGAADKMLGSYSGLAREAVAAGFRGFVAPLWSIGDDEAKEVSLGLYEAAQKGTSIGDYLRTVRLRFIETSDEVAHTTWMAYVFYGHPRLRLGGPERRPAR